MKVAVVEAPWSAKPVLRRLVEFHAHDSSEFDGKDVDEHGEYGYKFFDHYWTDSHRHPFLIRVDGNIAGYAFVSELHAETSMSEFFVLRKYRRRGVGRVVACDLFKRFPGPWKVRQTPGNAAATGFWRSVIPAAFDETTSDEGVVQRFNVTAD
jgi:predicted acetyltransferase